VCENNIKLTFFVAKHPHGCTSAFTTRIAVKTTTASSYIFTPSGRFEPGI